MVDKVKPGWKTTEFWGKFCLQIVSLAPMFSGAVPSKQQISFAVGLEVLYLAGRVLTKTFRPRSTIST